MTLPLVSVILPIRNEAQYIARSLGSVLAQDYPPEMLETLVVDGMSDDGTREILQEIIARHPGRPISLLDNPQRTKPAAFNIGLARAKGDVIIPVDGHCELPPDYIASCLAKLRESDADCVGGQIVTIGETYTAQVIALAQSSSFGVGGVAFRTGRKAEGYVDTVAFGAYKRQVFERIGGYRVELVRHQDYELNLRLRQAGGKILYSPRISSRYHCRGTLTKLAGQYFQYGYWKAQVSRDNPQAFRPRHVPPILLVLLILVGALSSILLPGMRLAFAVALALYLLADFAASVYVASAHGWRYLLLLPIVFPALHMSWGAGFWVGMLSSLLRGRSVLNRCTSKVAEQSQEPL